MIKFRDAQYCNLKIFLIFLVIYGHLIEPRIWESDILMMQYRWIYLIHMPLFSFLSGLFLHNARGCKKQLIRIFPLYVLLQTIAVIAENGEVKPLTPFWHLWYLLSCCIWLCFAWIWFRFCKGKGKIVILIASAAVGCAAGLVPFIGRELSLSRTLVFFPYFWIGLLCDPSFPWKKLRIAGVAEFVISFWMIVCGINDISVVYLYHAVTYENLKNGILFRLSCYLVGIGLGVFLLSFMTTKRFSFTKAGADTMPAYIIHAPIVLLLREWDIPWQLYIMISIGILYVTHILIRWHGNLYGIVSE